MNHLKSDSGPLTSINRKNLPKSVSQALQAYQRRTLGRGAK
jgi:hypothetical protein